MFTICCIYIKNCCEGLKLVSKMVSKNWNTKFHKKHFDFFRGGWGRHLFKVVLSVRYKFYTKTSEKREVSQDLQDCSLLIAIKHHCYTEFTVLLNLTVIIIMLPKAWFSYDCYDRCNH